MCDKCFAIAKLGGFFMNGGLVESKHAAAVPVICNCECVPEPVTSDLISKARLMGKQVNVFGCSKCSHFISA